MGVKLTTHTRSQSLVFLSASGTTDHDRLKHFFNCEDFGATAEERYDYFDELVNDHVKLREVLHKSNIQWPTSVDADNYESFITKLTNE